MDGDARKAVLSSYERFMTARFQDSATVRIVGYREILREKVMGLERALLNRAEYQSYLFYS